MLKYVLKRIVLMILSLFIIMTMLFVLIRLLPNQVESVQGGFDKALRDMQEAWGYNKPIITQYGIFLRNVFTKWDWGFCTTVGTFLQPVDEYIMSKLPATVYINVLSLCLSLPLGIIFGIIAAVNKNKWPDHVIQVFIMLFISVPSFVYAFLLQYIAGFKLNLFPLVLKGGNDWFSWEMIKSAVLPVLALTFCPVAVQVRLIRAELTETLTSDYMLLARTKGLSRRQATIRHAFRNSMVPLLPTFLADFLSVISGSMIIEQIFAVPGIGRTYLMSIEGIVFDLSYGFIDPRIRMGSGKTNEV